MSGCILHGHRPSDKSRSRWARRKTLARRDQRRAKLNAAQQGALFSFLEPEEGVFGAFGVEVRVEHGQLLVNGAYLHSDGEWATYPEGGWKS